MAQIKKKSALIAASVLSASACLCGVLLGIPASADEPPLQLQATYDLGAQITVPSKMLSDGGVEYPAEVVVTYPDGRAFLADTFVADQLGRYTVEYRVKTASGKLITQLHYFETQTDLYVFDGEKSTAEYGTDNSEYDTGITGLKVSLAPGETFYYNEVIDLREIGAQNTFIELFAMPTKGAGVRDVGTIVVKIEDAHNPENVVTVYGRSVESDGGGDPWWCNATYLSAGASGMTATGIEWGPPMKIHTSKFGFPISYSMYGYRDFTNSVGKETFGLKLDLEEKRVYGPKQSGEDYVIDLDEKKYFSNLWEGFSTGEVRISVSAETYFSESFDFMITKLGNSDIGAERLRDKRPPNITVQLDGYSLSALPDASVGMAYPVFAASASDVCAPSLPVTTKVFYQYSSTTKYELPIVDGAFVPDRAGDYVVEYTAKDYYGNVGTVVAPIYCTEAEQPIVITKTGAPQAGLVGKEIPFDVFSISGGIGNLEKQVSVTLDGREIDVDGKKWTPTQTGVYQISCSVTDMVGQKATETYEIAVSANPDPVFLQEAVLPQVFVKGVSYRLPALQAFDYNDGSWVNATLTVIDSNGGITPSEDGYEFDGEGEVTLTYLATTASGSAQKTYRIPVIAAYSGTDVNLSAFFMTENAQLTAQYTGLRFVKTADADMQIRYPIPLSPSQRTLSFTSDPSTEEISLTFTDSKDKDQSVLVQLKGDRNGVLFRIYLNGEDTGIVISKSNRINFEYVSEQAIVVNGNAFALGEATVLEGAYLSFTVKGAQNTALTWHSLGGTTLHLGLTDSEAPTLQLEEEYAKTYPLNTLFNVIKGRAFDLLSPEAQCTVTVRLPNGEYARSGETELNGVPATGDYSILLDEYGTYVATYVVTDIFGNRSQATYTFATTDNVPPVISVGWQNEGTFRVGELITFGKAVAVDDLDGNCQVLYFIVSPNGEITSIFFLKVTETAMTLSFLAQEKGTYIIRYFAIDETGNVAMHDEEIVVV